MIMHMSQMLSLCTLRFALCAFRSSSSSASASASAIGHSSSKVSKVLPHPAVRVDLLQRLSLFSVAPLFALQYTGSALSSPTCPPSSLTCNPVFRPGAGFSAIHPSPLRSPSLVGLLCQLQIDNRDSVARFAHCKGTKKVSTVCLRATPHIP
ncbi:hypothetical protein HBH56_048350 [Parastagonospora nodorum]|uniref:Secreted protein n=1 Tax=Phaeosphaeria nodorum (strain SN15 / ATCC MYA-4574 / FGSC 10173) TaxID=321614 RepID=A0A7U2HUK9_PHANO|nr:hypothetical protein HBH56_048350 [Parastagonospora nodorum]QRC92460.1 hypothetical protein JI435_402500 [Parastagonospora nodorum SN15]KAH3933095.1 hypothetical protein HBH54_076090 [Parastagonospora nodorum]KAH4124535.1 hypothetical protein HBH45_238830 [Parastagonospora nodorum]KAH4169135.1 hypothetical protein HBH44_049020 [Parastagonospora nodorum]